MLEQAGSAEHKAIPSKVANWVYENNIPETEISLWLGAARRPMGMVSAGRVAETKLGTQEPQPAWLFTIIIGRLILVSLGTSGFARRPIIDGPLASALRRIWPVPLVVNYPPRSQLDRDQVSLLLHMLVASLV
jgi:hypothetical protein